MNISLGSGKAVHAAYNGLNTPECGGNRASERYRKTNRDVTCKNCLKILAQQAPAAESVAQQPEVVEAPAAEVVEAPAAETEAPELDAITGWLVVTDRDGARYIVGPRITGEFGGVDRVLYRRENVTGSQRRAYADMSPGTLQRFLWDARARYDLDRQAAREAQRPAEVVRVAQEAEAEQLDTAREALLRQLAGIDARLAELRPATEPGATEVRVVMESSSIGSAWVNGTEYAVFRGLRDRWGVMGTGIRGNDLDGAVTALARRCGVTGPVRVTVVPPTE